VSEKTEETGGKFVFNHNVAIGKRFGALILSSQGRTPDSSKIHTRGKEKGRNK
jgi:hypothetical protein